MVGVAKFTKLQHILIKGASRLAFVIKFQGEALIALNASPHLVVLTVGAPNRSNVIAILMQKAGFHCIKGTCVTSVSFKLILNFVCLKHGSISSILF